MINKKYTLLILSLIITIIGFGSISVLKNITYAAPAPDSLVINDSTKECGYFWSGDETIRLSLPTGWKNYGWGGRNTFSEWDTPYGKCFDMSIKKCCEYLKLTYVDEVKGVERPRSVAAIETYPIGPDPTRPFKAGIIAFFSAILTSIIVVLW